MAYEHVLMVQKTIPINMTVADGAGIEKGAVLAMTDPNTAAGATAAFQAIAGIAAIEKVASDGKTQLAVISGPGDEFKATLSGTCTVGDPLVTWGDNKVVSCAAAGQILPAAVSGAVVIGYAKETGANGETIKYSLNIGFRP